MGHICTLNLTLHHIYFVFFCTCQRGVGGMSSPIIWQIWKSFFSNSGPSKYESCWFHGDFELSGAIVSFFLSEYGHFKMPTWLNQISNVKIWIALCLTGIAWFLAGVACYLTRIAWYLAWIAWYLVRCLIFVRVYLIFVRVYLILAEIAWYLAGIRWHLAGMAWYLDEFVYCLAWITWYLAETVW